VACGSPDNVLSREKEIAIGGHDGASRRVERFEESIVELDRWVSVVRGRKLWRRAGCADGAFEIEAWRDGLREGEDAVALVIDIDDAEAGVDRSLVRIRGWAEEVVEVEPRRQMCFSGERLINADRKLVGVGNHFG
jgi:hypothetical protein